MVVRAAAGIIKGSASSFMMTGVPRSRRPTSKTVVVTLEAPNSEFLGIMTAPYTVVINSDVGDRGRAPMPTRTPCHRRHGGAWFLEQLGRQRARSSSTTYRADDELRFTRNDNYWREPPPIRRDRDR